jgi:MFS family permease
MRRVPMMFRFSLYGFLKNQQYYDPFLMLIFLQEKLLSFTMIGLLFGFRELAVAVMEIPSGAVADLFGRRRSMIVSFSGYIVSFVIFALVDHVGLLFVAMFFFAIGEAFRTGTHKAMILHWLRLEGREKEKTKTYGYTRSWSKAGSLVSIPIAVAIVLSTGRMSSVFWFCLLPYVLSIINFLGYPKELEGEHEGDVSIGHVFEHLWEAVRDTVRNCRLRRIVTESMAYEGTFKIITKYYIQPVIKQIAAAGAIASLPLMAGLSKEGQIAILIGLVNLPLFLAAVPASRKAYRFAELFGGEQRAARWLWVITAMVFVVAAAALWLGMQWTWAMWVAIGAFVVASLLQNFWRPILITRVDDETDSEMGATMLSIESQAKAIGAMILAPLVGLAIDYAPKIVPNHPDKPALWVAGLIAAVITLAGAAVPTMSEAPTKPEPEGADAR